jgi:hypothetical protein
MSKIVKVFLLRKRLTHDEYVFSYIRCAVTFYILRLCACRRVFSLTRVNKYRCCKDLRYLVYVPWE